MPKMHQNMFGGWAPPGSTAGANALPQNPKHNRGPVMIEFVMAIFSGWSCVTVAYMTVVL